MDPPRNPASARGVTPLQRTPQDVAQGVFRVQATGGAIAKLTARQVEIVQMSATERKLVPVSEWLELNKIMMNLQPDHIDAVLRKLDENPPQAPDLILEPYQYSPLKSHNSVRLLHMCPEGENGLVQVSLDEYDLQQKPSYFCLSYCWNNPHAKSNTFNSHSHLSEGYNAEALYPIACNGRLLHVRANLYHALKELPAVPGLQVKRWYEFRGTLEKCTDLHIFAAEGDLALAKTHIFKGAMIDTRDSKGRTALGLAAMNGHLPVVKALLEAGSDPQIRDFTDSTCLDLALQHGQQEIVNCLRTFDPACVRRPMRKNKYIAQATKIWIDAICINQQDLQEKNEQVSAMDRIYSQASFVTIWLGRDDGTGAAAVEAVHKIFRIVVTSADRGYADFEPYKVTNPATCQRLGRPYISELEWQSLATLYLRQQFSRIWCLQEAVLADEVVIYMGENHVTFDEFMMVTDMLYVLQQKYAIAPSSKYRPDYTAPVESEANLIAELRTRRMLDESSVEHREQWFCNTNKQFWRGEGRKCQISLLEMILSAVTFECSDPHDHIYGLLGMCKGHPESPEIEIDYTKPWEELYTDVMRLCLISTGTSSLELVSSIRDSANYKNEHLPSWVLHFGQAGISPVWKPHHAAAGDYSQTWNTERCSTGRTNELIVEGSRVDFVKDFATKRPSMEQVSMWDFDTTWPSLVLSLPQVYPHTEETRTEVLWRTLCGDSISQDDIEALRRRHASSPVSTSAEFLSMSTKAPSRYAVQFRTQLLATILSHAEKLADMRLRSDASQAGVLLQTSMSMQAASEKEDSEEIVHTIPKRSEAEEAEICNISLEGAYFSDPSTQQAIETFEVLHQTDSLQCGGPGCSTPSTAEISAFLQKPTYRVWYPNATDPVSNASITGILPPHAREAQTLDALSPGHDGFRTQFTRLNGGRRLFVTETQRYLGLGPMSMQLGDELWIVKGSKVPFLLRKVGEEDIEDLVQLGKMDLSADGNDSKDKYRDKDRHSRQKRVYYKYVGDLYVHGIMNGEAVTNTRQWEEIALV